ncbi:hypothetical protein SAMN04488100_14617 [Alkalibacterium putridalgicola]|uniref:DUF6199 domain-containing protein n=1 Tax=Alkalibacterium putridalgicola TaxID=426703 RepID=A0A1H7X7G9_9LACT|nr:hypothetical protein APU01nite_21110 [Alkalibacterium putridalgicola]SEM29756.1 hypothetical protein SAMN04488100_14617 [Alkalibacterium putridalgicola]
MLIVIGIALIVYGYFSFKCSDRWAKNAQKRAAHTQFPEWFPLLIRVGGILFIISGILLIVSYALL